MFNVKYNIVNIIIVSTRTPNYNVNASRGLHKVAALTLAEIGSFRL